MFTARRPYLFLTSIVFGIASCSGESGATEPAAAQGSAKIDAAMSGMSASVGTATSTGEVAMTGAAAATAVVANNGAGASANAPASHAANNGAGANAPAGQSVGTTGTAGTVGMSAAAGAAMMPASSAGAAAPGGATFTKVFNLLAGGCASGGYCHAAGGGLSKLELVDQTKAYMDLVGVTAMGMTMPNTGTMGCSTSMIMRVKANDPDNSLLMQKLRGSQTCGAAMPPNGMLRPNELQLVRDWIAAGAKND